MKMTILAVIAFEIFTSTFAFASGMDARISKALEKFEGTYRLIDKMIGDNPKTEVPGVCYDQILVERVKGGYIDFEISGLPSGQGLIVVQMSNMNKGHQMELEENPMFPGISGTHESDARVEGNTLTYKMISRSLDGSVRFAKNFHAVLNGKVLDYALGNYRMMNGFEASEVHCKYERQ